MFYKALAPGCIGHSVPFARAAGPAKERGYEGYWFDAKLDFTGDPERILELLEASGLKAAGFGLPINPYGDEAAYAKDLASLPDLLAFAAKIGAARTATWVAPSHQTMPFEENFGFHVKRLRPVAKMLEDHGVLFGLEFIGPKKLRAHRKYEFIYDLDGMLTLREAIGAKGCGILMDAWHWHMAGQKFEDFGKLARPEDIACVHIMDAPANIPDDDQEDSSRRLPGATGVLNIHEFFEGLLKIGYRGPVIAEPFERFLSQIGFERALSVVMASMKKVWPE